MKGVPSEARGRPWPREREGPAACDGRDGAKRKAFGGNPLHNTQVFASNYADFAGPAEGVSYKSLCIS